MTMSQPAFPVHIPLLNPNETDALLAALHVHEGQQVQAGELLCTLETTKSAADLIAEGAGYVTGLVFSQGQTVRAGELLCYLAPEPGWQPPASAEPAPPAADQAPANLRITQPALALARQHNLDLTNLPPGELITEKHIRRLLEQPTGELLLPSSPLHPDGIVIYGGGGHGKALIDLLRSLGTYPILGILDDRLTPGTLIMGVPVLGGAAALAELARRGVKLAVNAVGGIGNIQTRIKVFKQLADAGFTCPALVHPRATVEASAHMSAGVQVFPHAYIGSEAQVGFGVIVNTGAIVSHDCVLGDYTNLSPGAILAGEVKIGPAVLVGMGVTVNLQVSIGANARIGNSAVLKSDLPAGGIVRAGTVWPADS